MSDKKSMVERQPKDERLTIKEKQLNEAVSSRLQEKYNEWSKGKPKKETSREALAKAIENELEVSLSPATVKKHLSGDNESAVSLPVLCWYAQKFGTSVNYLLTGLEETPQTEPNSEAATVSDVMDALRLLLDTFEDVIELTPYKQDVTYCVPVERAIGASSRNYYALKFKSEVIQSLLENWNDLRDFTRHRRDKKEKLKKMIFYSELEMVKEDYDSISKSTGVFYDSSDQPAFVKPRSDPGAVPMVMPIYCLKWFAGKTLGWESHAVDDGTDETNEAYRAIIEKNEMFENTLFCNDSEWDERDVYKATLENGVTLEMFLENNDQKESGEPE